MHDLIIGLDAGTSMVKATAFDRAGLRVALVAERLTPNFAGERAEQDMQNLWDLTCRVLRQLVEQVGSERVAGLGVTGQGDGCWLVDENLQPVGPAILWCDGRAASIVEEWQSDGTTERVFAYNGCTQFPGSQAAILRWLDIHEPARLARARWALYCKDWLLARLTGKVQTDLSDASLPFLDVRSASYSDVIPALLGLAHRRYLLPPLASTEQVSGLLLENVAGELGLAPELPVLAGPFDIAACAIGVGALSEGSATTILGSTALSEVTMTRPNTEPVGAGMTLCFLPGSWLRVMAVMMGTPNLDWFLWNLGCAHYLSRKWQQEQSENADLYNLLDEAVKSVPPGSGGVIYHPYLSPAGERAPFTKVSVRAQFFGLSIDHDARHLLRAVYEGVAFAIRDAYESMPLPLREIRLTGGGAHSAAWCQILADVTGKEIITFEAEETGCLGMALRCAAAVDWFPSLQEAVISMVHRRQLYEPDTAHTALYDRWFELYREIYHSLWTTWDNHARLLRELRQAG
jgi:sugar (pentulose or hexulose) kinase